jgi:hypothetical protein
MTWSFSPLLGAQSSDLVGKSRQPAVSRVETHDGSATSAQGSGCDIAIEIKRHASEIRRALKPLPWRKNSLLAPIE